MVSSQHDDSAKHIVDSIHGNIPLTNREVQVIDTPSFQRLRQLKQLAMAQLVYPTATHTRFAHSIGALGTMIRIIRAAEENRINFGQDVEENLRLAALLHDIGHYPYSHLMEKLDDVRLIEKEVEGVEPTVKEIDARKSKYPEHEEVGSLIATGQDDLVKAIGGEERAKAVADIFTRSKAADAQLSKLIHSSFDIDRWDYLLRDSYATGVPYGHIDINYLLNNLKVSPQKVVGFSDKALPAVEHFLLARFFMQRTVYYHKTIYGMEEACRQLLRRLRDRDGEHYGVPTDGEAVKNLVTSGDLRMFTDAFVDNIIQRAVDDEDSVVRALAKSIQSRRPPALLKKVPVCEETESQYHAGKTFIQNCKAKLRDLADEFQIPLQQFLLCEPKSTIVKHHKGPTFGQAAQMKPDQIKEKASEEEEEDIKIFVGDDEEPTSLMDIEHSLVVKYANYFFQMFRLYVVYEDKDDVVTQLREKVKGWDKA
ncbi:MAG TPA: HD domain-containing protein [Planctomycetes bacterium]|nr:HD domain-containing protein [Planctomycetota bacterium]